MLDQLNEMNGKLEEIQKSLDMYLETKRQIFPRFYFLSNDDLLEILGQSKNPEAIQPHLKKCFDNIKSLKMTKVGLDLFMSFLICVLIFVVVTIMFDFDSAIGSIFLHAQAETNEFVMVEKVMLINHLDLINLIYISEIFIFTYYCDILSKTLWLSNWI